MSVLRTALCTILLAGATSAQWLHYPSRGTPRNKDGTPNLSAPAPKLNGKPDLSGVWQVEPTPLAELKKLFGDDVDTFDVPGDDTGLFPKYLFNIAADYPKGNSPLLPAAAQILDQRERKDSAELPYSKCLPAGVPLAALLPFPFKIVATPGLTLIVHESDASTRQVYTDGRKHTPDPQPTWNGYSVGRWQGDELVVDTVGLNSQSWLDAGGTPHSESLRVVERFRRRDFGHLEVRVTLDDPQTFRSPVSFTYTARLLADSDLQENVCLENEKDLKHVR